MKKYIGLIIGLLPLIGSSQMVITNNYYVKITGGSISTPTSIVLTTPGPAGITRTGGWIVSENEFNTVQWNIGTNTGTYVVPFGDSTLQYLPLTLNISTAGVGSGVVKFSTYNSTALNTPNPSDVTNLNAFILPGSPSNADDAYNIADRFYIIDANTGYTTKPAAGNITFSYISGTAYSEVAAPNTLTESHLMGERFNSSTSTWSDWFGYGCTDAIVGNVGTVQTGPVPAVDMYRSWSLWDNLTPLPLTMVSTNSLCGGGSGSGSATVTVYGGEPSYTYAWTPSGGTLATASGLSAGTYTVSVNDASGCISTMSVTITAPPAVTATATVTANASACANIGSASVTAGGGTSPYTYTWTGGSTSSTATALSAGSYTVTVEDKNGCSATASVSITAPPAVTATATVTANATGCAANGSASVVAGGGTSPYTYAWTGGSTSTSATGLSAGSYTITVTDNQGCTGTASVSITAPPVVSATATVTANATACANTGSATVTPSGGTSPYTYAWTGGSTSTSATGLSAGGYTVTVTDNSGCTGTASVTITAPPAVSATATVTANATACTNTGSATVTPGGGTSPYTYTWTGGSTSTSATGLSAGSYTVTVTDNNGCTGTASVTITAPPAVSATATVTANSSACGDIGSASVVAGGGTSPYTYSWTGGGTNSSKTGLSAGTYTVTVTDNNGCTGTSKVTITAPAALSLVQHSVPNTDFGGLCNGKAWVTVSGGTAAYTYSWSPGGGTTDTITSQCAGTYCCKVTDANGCVDSTCIVVTAVQDISNNASSIRIYPDPSNGNFTVDGVLRGQIIELYNYLGQLITSAVVDNSNAMHFDISTKANGVYLIRIQNTDGSVVLQKKIVKTQ